MRITISQLMICAVLTGVSYADETSAQGVLNNPVKIGQTVTTLNNALRRIEKSADVKFVYSKSLIDVDQMVMIGGEQDKLSAVLDELLHPRGITYEVVKNQIVLSPQPAMATPATAVTAPSLVLADIVVTGKVTDDRGEPLIGVSVKIKGAAVGVATNASGNYSINIPSQVSNPVLVFSYIGFTAKEIPVTGRTNINVSLTEDNKTLNEVVVVGYNVVRKSDVTGSVVSVGSEEIRSRPVANALQAVQGKAAGVDITSNERPGEMGRILIRGVRSLRASSDPLFVVDGIPLAAGGLEAINPNDIEKIDVLKDASATAVYGSRGANGVVLVTTKRGQAGRLNLNYVGTSTIEKMYDRTEMMNSEQYIEFRRDSYRRISYLNPLNGTNLPGYPVQPTLADDQRIFAGDAVAFANIQNGWQNGTWNGSLVPTTNWTDMVLKTGVTHDHIISASGGTDKVKAYGSFGYLKQDGTQLGQDFRRYTAKFSTDLSPVKWLTFGASITGTFGNQNFGYATTNATGPGNLYFAAQGMLPYAQPFDANGNRINLPGGDVNIQNPIGEDEYNINLRRSLRALGSFYTELNILKGLKYRINFGPDFYNLRNGRWQDARSINRGAGEPGAVNEAQLNQTYRFAWTLDNLLYYNTTFKKDHNFGLTLLQSASSDREETSSNIARGLPWSSQKWYALQTAGSLYSFGTGLTETSLSSYMGRLNYDYKGKYLFTASGRWDGSSRLAEGNKWDFFPAATVAWRMEQEKFLNDVSWVDQMKLRVGVGSTGNAAVEPYTTKSPLETLYYTWGSTVQPGYVSSDASLANPVSMPNYELGWEHTTQWNLGLDFSFLRGRIGGSLDVYTSKTKDLLMLMSINAVTGYVRALDNVGQTANRGLDLTLNTINLKKSDFEWSSTLNFSTNRDKIVQLARGKEDDVTNLWFIGERLNTFYDYEKVGIWQDTPDDQAEMAKFNANIASKTSQFRPGSIRVADLNGDYKIDANNDRKIVGHAQPNMIAGLTNTLNYKNWDLSFFIYSRWGYTVRTGAESLQGRFGQRLVDYWTPTNPTNAYPAPNYNSAAGDPYRSSMNYQDGSFIKLRNISLAYNVPKSAVSKIRASNVRVYAQVMNPGLLYSKIDWIDPDLGGSTFNRGVVFGLNVGF